ncbi:MAG: RHS repeat domain-containing protein [Phycisphaerae bacterium]
MLAREFVWGTEFRLPAVIIDWTAAGQVGAGQPEALHYLRDVLGNVVALTDANANAVDRYRYDPYGVTYIYTGGGALLPPSAYGNPFAFTGQRYDAAVMLYHFWYRTYSPSLGRWHQRDPLQYMNGVNLYQYVMSSPMNAMDLIGLQQDQCPADEIPHYWPEGLSSDAWAGSDNRGDSSPSLNVQTESDDFIHVWFWGLLYSDDVLVNMTDGQAVFVVVGGSTAAVVGGYGAWYLAGSIAGQTTVITVSRWGRPGLQPGDWIMKGPANGSNYFWSGKWDPFPWNRLAPFSSGQEFLVPSSSLFWPPGWEFFKGLVGQRIYVGSGPPVW